MHKRMMAALIIHRRIGATGLHARIEGKGKGSDFPMSRTSCSAK